MQIGVIDADLLGRKRHRFPNLACMKISGYYKERGNDVKLITYYDTDYLKNFDKIFLSKVFTDTKVPEEVLNLPNCRIGGTGFYFDKAPDLPYTIEHHKPDYDLYTDWVEERITEGIDRSEFKEYLDYSIGFTTRGCFRKCGFCVNQKYSRVLLHSPLEEFYDPEKPKICLLDDNILGSPYWKDIWLKLISTGKPFKYKQGLDERLLTEEKCEIIFNCKYDGDYTFAFDNIADYRIIEEKLKMIRRYTAKVLKFYVLVGFDGSGAYDTKFWVQDVIDAFERIDLLRKYRCLPYIMRFNMYDRSPYRGMYINLARWCNQPSFFKKKSFREYCTLDCHKGKATERYMLAFEKDYPEIAKKYFDKKWEEV